MPCRTPLTVERSPIRADDARRRARGDLGQPGFGDIDQGQFAPSSAKAAAAARPIPLAAPVIRTFLPSRSRRIAGGPGQGRITAKARARMPSPPGRVSDGVHRVRRDVDQVADTDRCSSQSMVITARTANQVVELVRIVIVRCQRVARRQLELADELQVGALMVSVRTDSLPNMK